MIISLCSPLAVLKSYHYRKEITLAHFTGISLVSERQLGKPDVRLFVFPHQATSNAMSNKYSLESAAMQQATNNQPVFNL